MRNTVNVLPEAFREIPVQKVKPSVAKLPKAPRSLFRFEGSSLFFFFEERGRIRVFGPALVHEIENSENRLSEDTTFVLDPANCYKTTIAQINPGSIEVFDVPFGLVSDMIERRVREFDNIDDIESFVYTRADLWWGIQEDLANRQSRLLSLPEDNDPSDEVFFKKHGRKRFPGEPAEGFQVRIFKDANSNPLVLNSVLAKNEEGSPLVELVYISIENHDTNLQFWINYKTLDVERSDFRYLGKMTKEEFTKKYLMSPSQKALDTFHVVDSFFEKPLSLPVSAKLFDRIEKGGEDFSVKNGALFVKPPGRVFACVAKDSSEESSRQFCGKILLGSKRLDLPKGLAQRNEGAGWGGKITDIGER